MKHIEPLGNGKEATIQCSEEFSTDSAIGDSISINGVCSTVITKTSTSFTVQFLEETLKKTTMGTIQENEKVNLEPCLTLQTKLGGHLVSGHVDDTGTIQSIENDGQWAIITIEYRAPFAPFLIPKGSIAMDGISLTVVDLTNTTFTCHLIPHTLANTNLHTKQPGDKINLEFDQVAKYLVRQIKLNQTS
jgi:riboflavin synthase